MSLDDEYRLHFLLPGGHIGFVIESPILHIKHQARLIPYSKICTWKQNGDSISIAVSEMRQFCQNPNWSATAILYSKYNDSCYIYNIVPY